MWQTNCRACFQQTHSWKMIAWKMIAWKMIAWKMIDSLHSGHGWSRGEKAEDMINISIILCTRDRAKDLQETLCSLERVAVPAGSDCELLLIDNASTDDTPQVISAVRMTNMTVRHFREPKAGKSLALNLGLAEAEGDTIVFTDDDLRHPAEWLEVMTQPLRERRLDAVAGAMSLAPHLERPWMGPMHRLWLAAPPEGDAEFNGNLVGANMAFRREVLSRVPGFDPELGPGAAGFGDDTLFGHQLLEAGYKTGAVPLRTEHHFLPERLTRASFLSHAKKLGASGAYTAHHWEHSKTRLPRLQLAKKIMQLAVWRRTHPAEVAQPEGMHPSEMHHLRSLHLYGSSLVESRRPRNYQRHGLVKIGAEASR